MTNLKKWIFFWDNKLATAEPPNKDSEVLVASRRAFLGLMAGAAAYAASSNPVIAALEHLDPVPALTPIGSREGVLEVLADDQWVAIGRVVNLNVILPEPETLSFNLLGVEEPSRFQGRRRSPKIEFQLFEDKEYSMNQMHSVLSEWQNALFDLKQRRLSDKKRTMRWSSFGVDTVFEGTFPTQIQYEFSYSEQSTVTLEVHTDNYEFMNEGNYAGSTDARYNRA